MEIISDDILDYNLGSKTTSKHTKETWLYALSRMLERASYYGFRAVIVLYMIGETLQMERAEALTNYGWLTASIVFSQIIGALFGDLLIGNRRSIFIGGIVQAIGAITLCVPSTIGLYIGLFLVLVGSGLFTPNIISNFGKLYLDKTKLLDAGFTIFYLAINFGSFVGILVIGYLGEVYGYKIGFLVSAALILFSLVPIALSKEITLDEIERSELSSGFKLLNIIVAFLAVGLFWSIYEFSNIRIFDLQSQLGEFSTSIIPEHIWQSLSSIFSLPIILIAIVLWTNYYSSPFFKLLLGFIFGALSFAVMLFIPEVPTEQHMISYLVSLLFLGISEIHIAPIIHSILTKYSNPKHLAILVSLAFIPTRLFTMLFGLFNVSFYSEPALALKIGIVVMVAVVIGLSIYLSFLKKN